MARTKSTPKQQPKLSYYSTSGSDQHGVGGTSISGTREAHQSVIAVVAWAQTHGIEILPLTWLPQLDGIGTGGTSEISQSLVNAHLGFAFKRLNQERDSGLSPWKACMAELCITSQSPIRDHPNILSFHGICFETPNEDKSCVLPVLVSEKAKYGSLESLMKLPRGQSLSFDQRLHIIHEVTSAVALLHLCNVIHGDIKPENVLVFEREGLLTAQVCDFGFSTMASPVAGQPATVTIPRTSPWNAPEHTFTPITVPQAQKTDIYSLALMCVWFLFYELVSGHDILPVPLPDANDIPEPPMLSWNWRKSIEPWKYSDNMGRLTRALFRTLGGPCAFAEHDQASRLCERLCTMLQMSPDMRDQGLEALLCLLREETHVPGDDLKPCLDLTGPETHQFLDITRILPSLVEMHSRVRRGLYQTLQDELASSCSHCQKDAAYQLALYNSVGFGGKLRPLLVQEWLRKSGRSDQQLQKDLSYIRHTGETMKHSDTRMSSLWNTGHLTLIHPGTQQGYYGTMSRDQLLEERAIQINEMQNVTGGGGLGLSHALVLALRMSLISIQTRLGDLDQAFHHACLLADECMMDPSYGPDSTKTWLNVNVAASIEYLQGNYAAGATRQKTVVKALTTLRGETDMYTLSSMADLSRFYSKQNKLEEADRLLVQALDGIRKTLGEDHPATLSLSNDMAGIWYTRGEFAQAEKLFRHVLAAKIDTFGYGSQSTLITMGNLAVVARYLGNLDEAERLTRRALDIRNDILPPNSPDILVNQGNLTAILQMCGDLTGAHELAEKCLAGCRTTLGPDHPDTLVAMHNLASILHKKGNLVAALDMYTACRRGKWCHPSLGPTHPSTLGTIASMGVLYVEMTRFEDARGCFLVALKALEAQNRHNDELVLDMVRRLAEVHHALGRGDEAEEYVQRALQGRKALATDLAPGTETRIVESRVTDLCPGSPTTLVLNLLLVTASDIT